MADKLPDFMIVGAAKCGTTSLIKYLEENPQVFVSEKKEPKYFTYEFLNNYGYKGEGDQITKKVSVSSFESYKKLFKKAKTDQIVGEGSVDTLFYYDKTISKIKNEIGDPKIIIMLRNPVDRAISAYSHLIRDERETKSFEEGLALERERLNNGYEYIWGYKEAGLYADAVAAFFKNFTHVKVIFFEDFINNTIKEVHDTLEFLGISEKHTFNTSKHNISGKPKNKILNRFLNKPSILKNIVKKLFTSDIGLKIKNALQKRNLEKITVSKKTKNELCKYFIKDVVALEKFLQKDLTNWKPKN